jgi:hypothetical protein
MIKLYIGVFGLIFVLIWLVEIWVEKASHKRRERDRERESRELRHITKSRVWWQEPPENGPEGDH